MVRGVGGSGFLNELRAGRKLAGFAPRPRGRLRFVERTLVRFRCHFGLPRAAKGLVREFLAKVTGYSNAQLIGLMAIVQWPGLVTGLVR